MKKLILIAILALAGFGFSNCGKTTSNANLHEPEFNGNVKDTDPCQVVREQKPGGVIVLCKGVCPNKESRCGNLKSRPRGTEQDWKDAGGEPVTYDSKNEYRCSCSR
jgi:hypothetical protein